MSVLVVHASKRGGTQGLAELIGQVLRDAGHDVRVEPAGHVRGLGGVTAVIVAGALYTGRWHKDARRFVRRNLPALEQVPTWLVASGPLDDSADLGTLPPVPQVAAVATSIGARGEVTFGGRLTPDAQGFPASAMAKSQAGDWRNEGRVRQWALEVHRELVV